MKMECLICCTDSIFMTVGSCEHKVTCLKCCLKLRQISKNIKCIYCNVILDEVAVIDDPETTFESLNGNITEFQFGICYTSGRTKGACFYLKKFRCPVKNCKLKDHFTNKFKYKKHLEEDHYRYLCNLCVEKSVLLLDE